MVAEDAPLTSLCPDTSLSSLNHQSHFRLKLGAFFPSRRNPWRATRGNPVSRQHSKDRRNFQFYFLCNLGIHGSHIPTNEIPESELVSHHLALVIPTESTDPNEEAENLHSFIQIPDHNFTKNHFAKPAWELHGQLVSHQTGPTDRKSTCGTTSHVNFNKIGQNLIERPLSEEKTQL